MENNIFVKQKTKYNPDVEVNMKSKEDERNNMKFNLSTTIYNPITGIIPTKLNSSSDLVLPKEPNMNTNIMNMLKMKENERKQQIEQIKPIQTKILNNNQLVNGVGNNNYIETFTDMKSNSINTNQEKNNNYNNILDGLKDLGIIK
jgi:hypothetical protein